MTDNQTETRVILLGASNIARGFPVMVDLLQCGFAGPIDLYAAFGHGRSYGRWSRVFMRELPGIRQCGLWENLSELSQHSGRTVALLTDIGNDLVYGVAPDELMAWVAECVEQLKSLDAELLITQIPQDRLLQLTHWEFRIAKACFFPISPIKFTEIQTQIPILQHLVADIAQREQIPCIEQPREWYSYDPIHHRGSLKQTIWQHVFCHWRDYNCSTPVKTSTIPQRLLLQWHSARERKLAGVRLETEQPVHKQHELTISLY